MTPTHWHDPTTAEHGNFWLLGFPPDPLRSSLASLHLMDSSSRSMLMSSLVRAPDQHAVSRNRVPKLKPSTLASLPEAGLKVHAKHPADVLALNR